jgi:hypothetical protein
LYEEARSPEKRYGDDECVGDRLITLLTRAS